MTTTTIVPQEIADAELAFPVDVARLMPEQVDIPEEFRAGRTKWNRIFGDWFYFGLREAQFKPREGIDQSLALRHLKAVMGSWEPKHEHKESAVAYLLSLWFEDVTYQKPVAGRS